MKQHKLNGFTLMEIIIAFVLLSFIVLMVGGAVTNAYVMAHKLRELPNTYYNAQGKLEDYTRILSDIADIENKRSACRIDSTDFAYLTKKLDELSDELSGMKTDYAAKDINISAATDSIEVEIQTETPTGTETETIKIEDCPKPIDWRIFDSITADEEKIDIPVYQVAEEYTLPGRATIRLSTGVVGTGLKRLVPSIESVEIAYDATKKDELYFGKGTVITATSEYYEDDNYSEYFKATLYQWYLSTGSFHTADYAVAPGNIDRYESQIGTIYPTFPNNYTPIEGEINSSITVKEEYYNKMLVCVATPLSKNGAMGSSVVSSNAIYISGLPKLTSENYQMVLEPSLIPWDCSDSFDAEKNIDTVTSINSRYPDKDLSLTISGEPTISLNGELTATDKGSLAEYAKSWSRYIRFTAGQSAKATIASGNMTVFAVVRSGDLTEPEPESVSFPDNVIFYKDAAGNIKNVDCSVIVGTGEWKIIRGTFDSDGNIINSDGNIIIGGGATVDIAELIIVDTPENDRAIIDLATALANEYLAKKYNITGNIENS